MKNNTDILPFRQLYSITDPLTELAREGARRMLAEALKAEADAFVASFADERLKDGQVRAILKMPLRHPNLDQPTHYLHVLALTRDERPRSAE